MSTCERAENVAGTKAFHYSLGFDRVLQAWAPDGLHIPTSSRQSDDRAVGEIGFDRRDSPQAGVQPRVL